MTESEWQACWYPGQILEVFADRLSSRQLRLFSYACCRRISHLVNDPCYAEALDALERFADGKQRTPNGSRQESWSRSGRQR